LLARFGGKLHQDLSYVAHARLEKEAACDALNLPRVSQNTCHRWPFSEPSPLKGSKPHAVFGFLLRPNFQRQGIVVSTQLIGSPAWVQCDEASLQRVLINLIDNGVDAMEGGGKLTVATRVSPAAGNEPDFIVIEISDSGAGIAPEVLPRIFEMFVTTKAPGRGTGLGLAVCQQIVRAHGGAIRVHSDVGKGTSVHVSLPAAIPAGPLVTLP
jgi:signal transduction histidine kinase